MLDARPVFRETVLLSAQSVFLCSPRPVQGAGTVGVGREGAVPRGPVWALVAHPAVRLPPPRAGPPHALFRTVMSAPHRGAEGPSS